jgi:predicted alpha/beta-fold hydrolase
MSSSFFRSCHVLTQRSGHFQTIYGALGNLSVVDAVVYDRQVVSHYYTKRRLIPTFAGGISKLKMAEPCWFIWSDLEELRSRYDRGLDFTPPVSDCVLPDETPIIVTLHGLSGGGFINLTVV